MVVKLKICSTVFLLTHTGNVVVKQSEDDTEIYH